jgi:hypothetical protein
MKKIVGAYTKIDFRPNPKVHFDIDRRECSPLVALVIAEFGLNEFLVMGRFFNSAMSHKKIVEKFSWRWVQGFNTGFSKYEFKKSWKQDTMIVAGHRVGVEIRRQLREIYYKPNG